MANNHEGFNFSTLVTAIHQVDEPGGRSTSA